TCAGIQSHGRNVTHPDGPGTGRSAWFAFRCGAALLLATERLLHAREHHGDVVVAAAFAGEGDARIRRAGEILVARERGDLAVFDEPVQAVGAQHEGVART